MFHADLVKDSLEHSLDHCPVGFYRIGCITLIIHVLSLAVIDSYMGPTLQFVVARMLVSHYSSPRQRQTLKGLPQSRPIRRAAMGIQICNADALRRDNQNPEETQAR